MNWLDIVLILPMGFLMYKGWRRGVVREAAALAGLIAGLWASTHLLQWVMDLLGMEGESAVLIAFFICFAGSLLAAYLLGRGIEKLMKAAHFSIANRIGGAFMGMMLAVCIMAVLLNYIVMLDKREVVLKNDVKANSLLYRPVFITGNALTSTLKSYAIDHKDEWIKEVTQ